MVIGMRPRLRRPRRNRWCSRPYQHARSVSGATAGGCAIARAGHLARLLPGIADAPGDRCGRGPRPDPAIAAQHAARHPRVLGRVLQAPHRIGTYADHVVAVPDGIPGGLDPGHPSMPGSVPLMLLPAQQMRDPIAGQLHDRRRPRPAAGQLIVLRSHRPRIRNQVLLFKILLARPHGPRGLRLWCGTRAAGSDAPARELATPPCGAVPGGGRRSSYGVARAD